jgi:RNA-directed DNA polymerase
MEIDHKLPKSQGGSHSHKNLELLHRHCHDVKTALDSQTGGLHDKHQLAEEPCEGKLSRTVLKTSRFGDGVA